MRIARNIAATTALLMATTGLTVATAPEADATIVLMKNSSDSTRIIRVWRDLGCPQTQTGFARSEVLYAGDWSPWAVQSFYMAPYRKVVLKGTSKTYYTGATAKCIEAPNLQPVSALVTYNS